jgi:hypothetical protein
VGGGKKNAYRVWWGKMAEKGLVEGQGVERMIMVKCIL